MYYVYILKCNDSTLYTGYTTDLKLRVIRHKQGIGAKYTRGRLPVELVYQKPFKCKSAALKEEYRIKKLSRLKKISLIKDSRSI